MESTWTTNPGLSAALGQVACCGAEPARLENTMQRTAETLGGALNAMTVIALRTGEGEGLLVPLGLHHPDPRINGELEELLGSSFRPTDFLGARAFEHGETVCRHDVGPEDLTNAQSRFASIAEHWDLNSILILPLSARSGRLGAIAFLRLDSDPSFNDHDLAFARTAAALTATVAEDALLLEAVQDAIATGDVTAEWRPARRAATAAPAQTDDSIDVLSSREREIVALIARGHTSREIADQLVLSVRTVEWHRGRLQWKLGVSSRAELIVAAERLGLLRGVPRSPHADDE